MRVSSSAAVRSKAGRPSSSAPGRGRSSGSPRRAGELGTDLAHALAEADDVVEPLVGELAEVLGSAARELDPRRTTRTASGCSGLGWLPAPAARTAPLGQVLGQRLGHLRAGAVAVHRNSTRACADRPAVRAHRRRQPRMQRRAGIMSCSPQRISSRT